MYVLWDVLVMFTLLCREYYLIRIGMWYKIETDIETLEEANSRLVNQRKSTINKNKKNKEETTGFFDRLLPRKKGEKPGQDFYLFTFMFQLSILIYLFIFFAKIDGNTDDIATAIRSNQFQGRMVISIFIVVLLILLDRYLYLMHTSRAFQDAADEIKKAKQAENEETKEINEATKELNNESKKNEEK